MHAAIRRTALLCLALGALLVGPVLADSDPDRATGLIVGVRGDVVIARRGSTAEACEGSFLELGDTVVVRTGSWCKGILPSGSPFELNGPAQLETTAPADSELLREVLGWIREQVEQWRGRDRRRALTTRGTREWDGQVSVVVPLFPAPNAKVRASWLRFVWQPIPGVANYQVTLAPIAGEESQYPVRGHHLQLDALEPGQGYDWRLAAEINGTAVSSEWRHFAVMAPADEAVLDKSIDQVDDLEAGVLLLAAGLHEEAIHRLDAATTTERTRRSALAWRSRAFSEIGLHEKAYADLVEFQSLER